MTIFKVNPKDGQTRLVKAENLKQVKAHLLEEFTIEEASAEDAHALGKSGVQIETANE